MPKLCDELGRARTEVVSRVHVLVVSPPMTRCGRSPARAATPAQVRLAWTLHRGPHVLAIPGTGNPDHLVTNIAAGALSLSVDELASLG